jgi:hypothetical protein
LAVLAVEFSVAGGEDFGGRGRGAEDGAEAIDTATFKVDAGKQRSGDALLAIAQEMPRLLGSFYVAREQYYSGGLETREQRCEARGHLRGVEADDQELADLIWSVHEVGFSRSDGGP